MISANNLERPEPLRLALLPPGPLSQPVLGFPKVLLLRVTLLQEGGAFPGPQSGLLSNTEVNCPRRHQANAWEACVSWAIQRQRDAKWTP